MSEKYQGCEWQIIKKEENSRVAFRAERFALKIALYYDFGHNIQKNYRSPLSPLSYGTGFIFHK